MPKLLETNRISLDWTDIAKRVAKKRPKGAGVRSSGVHLSGIIQHCLGLGKGTGSEDEEEYPLCMAIGCFFEEGAIGLWPEIEWQPGEAELDGVFGSPDGSSYLAKSAPKYADITRLQYVIEEFKATWQSRRTHGEDILKETKWMWQLAGYCHMNAPCNHARLHVGWMCGEYKFGPPKPEYFTYLIAFGEQELEEFWRNVVLKNKDAVKGEEHG